MIALFGGSFNPLHKGHLLAAKLTAELPECKEVWFLPCYKHRFKKNLESFSHRTKMIETAIKNNKKFKLCKIEKKLAKNSQPNTTAETLRALKKLYPKKKFCFAIGSNLLPEIKKWHNFPWLKKNTCFIIIPLKNHSIKSMPKINAIILKKSVPGISSTKIRQSIQKGSIPKTIPKPVSAYIEKHLLFTTQHSKKVYSLTQKIPKGYISSYKEIAIAINSSPRAVGQALNKNPFKTVPCHRIIKSNGLTGGYRKGSKRKQFLLKKEGITIKKGKIQKLQEKHLNHKQLIKLKNIL